MTSASRASVVRPRESRYKGPSPRAVLEVAHRITVFAGAYWRLRRTVVRQFDRIDCGPSALLWALRFVGGDAKFAAVRAAAGTSVRGTSLAGLGLAAEEIGFDASGAVGTLEELGREPLPAIAHIRSSTGGDHFVVVAHVAKRFVLLGDPAMGVCVWSSAHFNAQWQCGTVLLLTARSDLKRDRQPSAWQWLLGRCWRFQPWMTQTVFTGVLYTLLALTTSVGIQWLIDDVIPAGRESQVVNFAVLLLAVQLIRAAIGVLRQRFLIAWSESVGRDFGQRLGEQLLSLPAGYFESRTMGDLTSRLQDTTRVQAALGRLAATALLDGVVILGAVAYIGLITPRLLPLLVIGGAAYTGIIIVVSRRFSSQQRMVIAAFANLESAYTDTLRGVQEVRGYDVGAWFAARLSQCVQRYQRALAVSGLTQAVGNAIAEAVGGAMIVAGLGMGAVLVLRGQARLGEMLASYAMLATVVPAIVRLVDAQGAVQSAIAGISRLMDVDAADAEYPDAVGNLTPPMWKPHPIHSQVAIQAGAFAWPTSDPIFSNVDLVVPIGRITAITGASGTGKSTLAKVLQRKYPLSAGVLLIDGEDSSKIPLPALRRAIAVVPDNASVFADSLAMNITLGRSPSTEVPLTEWAISLGFGPFLSRFDLGLATPVGEMGRQLSAGERQVVALLRALYGIPAVLIVDEAVNAMDRECRGLTVRLLDRYACEHAVLVISHDASLLRLASRVYRFEAGGLHESTPEASSHCGTDLDHAMHTTDPFAVASDNRLTESCAA